MGRPSKSTLHQTGKGQKQKDQEAVDGEQQLQELPEGKGESISNEDQQQTHHHKPSILFRAKMWQVRLD